MVSTSVFGPEPYATAGGVVAETGKFTAPLPYSGALLFWFTPS